MPQTPELQVSPEQQSVLEAQLWPLDLQVGAMAQTPLRQLKPEQQSLPVEHPEPEPTQGFWQVPPLHSSPSQHS